MKITGMSRFCGVVRLGSLATLIFCAPIANAQNALPQTPPELKDFRLDKKPEPPREAAPTIIVPDVKPATPDAEPKPQPTATTQPSKPRAATPSKAAPQTAVKPSQGLLPPETVDNAPVTPLPGVAPVLQAEPSQPAVPAPATGFDPSSLPWAWIAGALALAAIALFAVAKLRTGRATADAGMAEEDFYSPVPATLDEPIAHPVAAPFVEEMAPEALIIEPVAAKSVAEPPADIPRPLLEISFVPDKATISLANLTIRGQLRIINQGKAAAHTMKLRAVLISASEVQDAAIDQFHEAKDLHFTEYLGEAGIAERIGMDLELSIPLSELRSYLLGDQRLFVPIMLANIEYGWGEGGHDVAQLACLIGREANPPKPKMAPLRLDLGPRSFAPLGQRPVFG
jgi:hypothetical protein